jgi:DNA-binding CsgD family transcriptional regulator
LIHGVTTSGIAIARHPAKAIGKTMLENILPNLEEIDGRLHRVVPKGYMMALNIRHITPEFVRSTYDAGWFEIYTRKRYALFDPVVTWTRLEVGTTRWSEIPSSIVRAGGQHVFEHAREFGLNYGGAVSSRGVDGDHCLSVLSGARSDRELTTNELEELSAVLSEVVSAVGKHAGLTKVELEALQDLAAGLTHNEIADKRRVSPATVKKRLERARQVLGGRNAVQAVAIATRRGLILSDPSF